jgi:hypothetical protein
MWWSVTLRFYLSQEVHPVTKLSHPGKPESYVTGWHPCSSSKLHRICSVCSFNWLSSKHPWLQSRTVCSCEACEEVVLPAKEDFYRFTSALLACQSSEGLAFGHFQIRWAGLGKVPLDFCVKLWEMDPLIQRKKFVCQVSGYIWEILKGSFLHCQAQSADPRALSHQPKGSSKLNWWA